MKRLNFAGNEGAVPRGERLSIGEMGTDEAEKQWGLNALDRPAMSALS